MYDNSNLCCGSRRISLQSPDTSSSTHGEEHYISLTNTSNISDRESKSQDSKNPKMSSKKQGKSADTKNPKISSKQGKSIDSKNPKISSKQENSADSKNPKISSKQGKSIDSKNPPKSERMKQSRKTGRHTEKQASKGPERAADSKAGAGAGAILTSVSTTPTSGFTPTSGGPSSQMNERKKSSAKPPGRSSSRRKSSASRQSRKSSTKKPRSSSAATEKTKPKSPDTAGSEVSQSKKKRSGVPTANMLYWYGDDYRPIHYDNFKGCKFPIKYWFYVYIDSSEADRIMKPFFDYLRPPSPTRYRDRRLKVISDRFHVFILPKRLEIFKSLPRWVILIRGNNWASIVNAMSSLEREFRELMRYASYPNRMDYDTPQFPSTHSMWTRCINRTTI